MTTTSCTGRRCYEQSSLERLGQQYLSGIPDVWQIVAPLALEEEFNPGSGTDLAPVRATSFLEPRHYMVRARCKRQWPAHVFFLGLATAAADNDMTADGARKIASLMNDQHIVKSVNDSNGKCDAPFCHITLADQLEKDFSLKIEGLGYHCHCDDPFSYQCWTRVFLAAEKTAVLCKDLRKAKAAFASAV